MRIFDALRDGAMVVVGCKFLGLVLHRFNQETEKAHVVFHVFFKDHEGIPFIVVCDLCT